jgi:hypothetical protein
MKSWVLIFLGERTLLTYLIICMKRLLVQECSCTPRLFDHYQRAVQIHVQKMLPTLAENLVLPCFIYRWLVGRCTYFTVSITSKETKLRVVTKHCTLLKV